MTDGRYRTEEDSMGAVLIPADALYGPQTQRAVENFVISDRRLPPGFIRALVLIKMAAAETNKALGLLSETRADAIIACAQKILDEGQSEQFPVPVYQTGSGTSSNMNVNEVISTLAKRLGVEVSPNDHVNLCQSSNDVVPSALHLSTALKIRDELCPALKGTCGNNHPKGSAVQRCCENRTHPSDGCPAHPPALGVQRLVFSA